MGNAILNEGLMHVKDRIRELIEVVMHEEGIAEGLMHKGIIDGSWLCMRKALWMGGLMHEDIIEGRTDSRGHYRREGCIGKARGHY